MKFNKVFNKQNTFPEFLRNLNLDLNSFKYKMNIIWIGLLKSISRVILKLFENYFSLHLDQI